MAVQTTEMTSAPATVAPAGRSWAMIVKGPGAPDECPPLAVPDEAAADGEQPEPQPQQPQPVRPGPKGSWQAECLCRGKLLVMLGYYGWILPLDDIDHPDAQKNGGRIYVRKRDFPWGASPIEGDIVTFHLYADGQGLGAERCKIEGGGEASGFVFSAAAPEFVPATTTSDSGADGGAESEGDDSSDDSDDDDLAFALTLARLAVPAPEPQASLEAPPGLAAAASPHRAQMPALRAPPGLEAPPGLCLFSRPWASSKAASRELSEDGSTSADGSATSVGACDARCSSSSRSTSPATAKDADGSATPPWRRAAPWRRAPAAAA